MKERRDVLTGIEPSTEMTATVTAKALTNSTTLLLNLIQTMNYEVIKILAGSTTTAGGKKRE